PPGIQYSTQARIHSVPQTRCYPSSTLFQYPFLKRLCYSWRAIKQPGRRCGRTSTKICSTTSSSSPLPCSSSSSERRPSLFLKAPPRFSVGGSGELCCGTSTPGVNVCQNGALLCLVPT
ncbi:hypothetical protein FB45DRAFT_1063507, partial [Roridomyces roridus]